MTKTLKSREIHMLSVTRWFDPFIAVGLISGTYFFLHKTEITNGHLTLLIVLVTSAYLFLSELTRAPWKFSERPVQRFTDVIERTITKFFGVLVGIVAILFAIWLFPEYDNERNLGYLKEIILPFLAFVVPASFFLILATEYILGEKRDGTFQFGLLARLRLHEIDWKIFLDGVLEWLVRCIFLLINFFAASLFLSRLRTNGFPDPENGFVSFIIGLDTTLFTLILFAILPGYIFASRLINTHVKKVDHTWFGWAITLTMYSPINTVLFGSWARYRPPPETTQMLQGTPVWAYMTSEFALILYSVGIIIILMALVHLWAEALLGIRSANLSSRGVITTGPFHLTKHPVYVSKCIQWGFIYLPVLNAFGVLGALQSGLLFLVVCAIFAGRALAEEKLLAEDENYVKYALFMDEKSIFAFVGRTFPFMSFNWRYEYWKKNGYLPQ